MEKALRYNKGKLRWSLLDFESIGEAVKVLEFGALKYAVDNWKKGFSREELLESMQRHIISLFNKEEVDQESKLHHCGHIICNCMFYLFHYRNKTLPNVDEKAI